MANMDEVGDHVKLQALNLEEGQSLRTRCPACDGGSSNEESFSIQRKDGALLFNCFRDKCRLSGSIGSRGNFAGQSLSQSKNTKTKQYSGELFMLSDKSSKFLKNKFYLEDEDIRQYRETAGGDIMLPMQDHLGRRYGYVNRRYVGLVGSPRSPKTINYYDFKPDYNLHFDSAMTTDVKTVVLVEDIISARRIGKYTAAVALLGTRLTQEEATLLAELGVENVVFLLDADANASSQKQQKEYGLLFPACYSIRQTRDKPDPKDCTPDELQYLIDLIDHITNGESI